MSATTATGEPRSTPIALFCFNRPELTARTLGRIAEVKPKQLFVICDGPRAARAGESDLCRQVRSIATSPSWDCELVTNFSDTNLGCRGRLSSGISWLFERVEEAIILEDDCLADPTFFPFCAELLARYREDERIMMISGNNFQDRRQTSSYSYYFSRFTHIWGWATWRRAWRHYDERMSLWPQARSRDLLYNIFHEARAIRYWTRLFDLTYEHKIDTWDYQWTFACWMQSGLTVLPDGNLVSNVGFGADATHTMAPGRTANLPAVSVEFPLKHPDCVLRDRWADEREQARLLNLPDRIRRKLTGIIVKARRA